MQLQSELVQLAAPGAEPVSLADAKLWLRVDPDFTDDDLLIAGLITAARSHAEMFCRSSFKAGETYRLTLNRFPWFFQSGTFTQDFIDAPFAQIFPGNALEWAFGRPDAFAIVVPMGPVSAITSITYTDTTGALQTLDPVTYELLQNDGDSPRIYPTYGNVWPLTQVQPDAVKIYFTASGTVPAAVLVAMRQMIAAWYVNRDGIGAKGDSMPIVPVADMLMRPYRMVGF